MAKKNTLSGDTERRQAIEQFNVALKKVQELRVSLAEAEAALDDAREDVLDLVEPQDDEE